MSIFRVTRKTKRGIAIILDGRCEWCDELSPLSHLVLHEIVPEQGMSVSPDPQKRFLLLCRQCHTDLHTIPLPHHLQKDLVRRRSRNVRKALRTFLNYIPEPYHPPENFDMAEIYEECFSLRSLDLFRAGG
jgi:hypothetical protein